MDHGEAIRQMMAEQYLLGELTPSLREEFEEHFFSCDECASDIRAGAAFLNHSKAVLRTSNTPVAPKRLYQPPPWWQAWLRPAFVLPVMAVLVAAVSYQSFIAYPRLKKAAATVSAPQILPAVSLISVTTRGSSRAALTVRRGEPFLLFVDIAADKHFSSYVAELYGPAGTLEWSLPIPSEVTRDTVSIRVPGRATAGVYTLIVRGLGDGQQNPEVARFAFELLFQQ